MLESGSSNDPSGSIPFYRRKSPLECAQNAKPNLAHGNALSASPPPHCVANAVPTCTGDKHGRAVHHGNALTYSSLPGDTQLVVDFGVSSFPLFYLEAFPICEDDPNELRCALDVSYKGNWGMRTTSSRPSAAGLVVFESG
jgi:hypothetical protein